MTEPRGAALVESLRRRFVTVEERVRLGGTSLDILRPRSAEELISEDDFARDERLPYWADIWPSSIVLATRLLLGGGAPGTLLELGCGVGTVTAAAMRAGHDVLATDYYGDALLFTRANGWRATEREPRTRLVDWRHFPADLGTFDRVVAADVLYERPYAALVAHAVARSLAPGGEALIADPGRIAAEAFLEECESRGLRLADADVVPFEAGEIRQRVTVYGLRRRG